MTNWKKDTLKLKTSQISKLNEIISKFIVDTSKFESTLLKEAPDVWEPILMSMSMLSDVSQFLEVVKMYSAEEDLTFFNTMLQVNGMKPLEGERLRRYIYKERDIDLSKYKVKKAVGAESDNSN